MLLIENDILDELPLIHVGRGPAEDQRQPKRSDSWEHRQGSEGQSWEVDGRSLRLVFGDDCGGFRGRRGCFGKGGSGLVAGRGMSARQRVQRVIHDSAGRGGRGQSTGQVDTRTWGHARSDRRGHAAVRRECEDTIKRLVGSPMKALLKAFSTHFAGLKESHSSCENGDDVQECVARKHAQEGDGDAVSL